MNTGSRTPTSSTHPSDQKEELHGSFKFPADSGAEEARARGVSEDCEFFDPSMRRAITEVHTEEDAACVWKWGTIALQRAQLPLARPARHCLSKEANHQ